MAFNNKIADSWLDLKVHFSASLSLGSYFWQSNYNWVADLRNMTVEDLIRSQLQSEEDILHDNILLISNCIAVNFKSQ